MLTPVFFFFYRRPNILIMETLMKRKSPRSSLIVLILDIPKHLDEFEKTYVNCFLESCFKRLAHDLNKGVRE